MKAPKSELVSRAGVHYVGYVFSLEGIIFRETSSTDVGVDGQLELVTPEGIATGMLVGVQIKSGDSFVNKKNQVFSFKASKKHFIYWKKLSIPSIGIVYSPALRTASWFDLTKKAEEILNNSCSCIIKQTLNNNNIISIDTGLKELISKIIEYYKGAVDIKDVEKLSQIQKSDNEVSLSKENSWKRLISIFFASSSDAKTIAYVGYCLSWYFPVVSEEQKYQFKTRLQLITIDELNRIFGAIKFEMTQNREDAAMLIADLLSYHPKIISFLDTLVNESVVNPKDIWLIEQLKEYIE